MKRDVRRAVLKRDLTGKEFKFDGDGPEGAAGQVIAFHFNQVFLRADDVVAIGECGPVGDIGQVFGAIGEVVGEFAPGDELAARGGESVSEAGGVADAAEGGDAAAGE